MKENLSFSKLFLSLLLTVGFSTTIIVAQNYTISPSTTLNGIAGCDSTTIFNINFKNETTGKLSLSWKLLRNSIPACWSNYICDYGHCYIGIPAKKTMDSIPFDSSGFIHLYITIPADTTGSGTVSFYVYETADETKGDTITFKIDGCSGGAVCPTMLAIGEPAMKNDNIIVYPNPANDFLNISNGDINYTDKTIRIFNVIGKKIMEFPSKKSFNKINISNLPSGIYFIKLENQDGSVCTKRFCKN